MFVFVRTSIGPAALAAAIRREIYSLDPGIPVSNLMLLAERLDRTIAFQRNAAILFLVFAVVALLLASVGLYSSVSHSVNRRVKEIGIRVAVGATSRDVLVLVFRHGMMLPVATGLAIGLSLSFAANRALKSQLVGVTAGDPLTLIAASGVLILSATLACWIPARRAMRVDPLVALRSRD
jgi:putative ABC transport system permease protein